MAAAIRTVVIGYGVSGRSFHCYLVKKATGLHLHGVMTSDESKRTKIKLEHGENVVVYANYDDVVNDPQVDLIVIATPPDSHYGFAMKALNAKKNVVIDKPMCLNGQQCADLIAASEKQNVLLSVFMNRRLDGDFLTVKDLMDRKALGQRVRWIEMAWLKPGIPPQPWKTVGLSTGGGRFYDLGVHLVDQMLLLFPQGVTSVYCRMHMDFAAAPNIDSHATLIITFQDGSTGVVDTSSTACVPKPRYYVVGDTATYAKFGLDAQEQALFAGHLEDSKESESQYGKIRTMTNEETTVPTLNGNWLYYYQNISDSLHGKAKPFVSFSSLKRLMAVYDAALESASKNQVIQVNIPPLE